MTDRRKIDYNRGVIFQSHPATGMMVYMYLDTPGVYLNAYEVSVDAQIAQEAGFDTNKLGKEKLRRERVAKATAAIAKELEREEDEKSEPVLERDGFKVMDVGMERFIVVDPDGNKLNAVYLSRPVAENLLNALAPVKEKSKKDK